jgi:multidrug efflux pump subunit AcrA (membrane-fusion protein)
MPAMPNLTFHGQVARIADALQPGTRTLLTEIDVLNPDGALQSGVYCTVELRIPRQSQAPILPVQRSYLIRTACKYRPPKIASSI